MDRVWIEETDVPEGATAISGTFEVARVPIVGETMEFAGPGPGDERVNTLVTRVHFDQTEDGHLGAIIDVLRDRPSTITIGDEA